MKTFSIIALYALFSLVLALPLSQAQVLRGANNTATKLSSAAYQLSGTIEGSIFIKKSAIPNTTNINQVVIAIKNGLKAFEFVPQNNGLLSDQYIHVSKTSPLRGTTQIKSVKVKGDSFVVEYAIQKLPTMRPMMVKLTGHAAQKIRFAVEPQLKNFPVAYLTICDRTFECYNFKGSFIPLIH